VLPATKVQRAFKGSRAIPVQRACRGPLVRPVRQVFKVLKVTQGQTVRQEFRGTPAIKGRSALPVLSECRVR